MWAIRSTRAARSRLRVGAALVVVGLARRGDLGLEAALLEQEEVELHRLDRGGLVAGEDHQLGDQAGQLVVVVGQVGGEVLGVLAQPGGGACAAAARGAPR